ncbi:MAG TPA: hypothetical protein VGK19_09755 [Capsulimonadaceae bacterium]|jgi:hypothetical protein
MRADLLQSIQRYIVNPAPGQFEPLTLALFRRQYDLNSAYRRYVDACPSAVGDITSLVDIPSVPAQAFKTVSLSCTSTDGCAAVFESSGTTQALAGKHWMDSDALALYELSLVQGYDRIQSALPANAPLWAIMPPAADAPHSSLSHMLATLGASHWFWDDWSLLARALTNLTTPIVLFGTGFAFVALFDAFPETNWPLPAGSVVINTGGFKGRTREIARTDFYSLLRDRFELPDGACLAEYGMSEMASQFYAIGEEGAFLAPPWLRTRIIDPYTGDDVEAGEPGLLRVYDLANWNSVLAIQTQDMAVADGAGFRLLGRAPDADVRGCSLTVEELWTRE